jgi:ribonuclease P protein component
VERLRRRGEFLRVAAAGRKCAVPGLVLQACPIGHSPDGHSPESRGGAASAGLRYGLTVSRKVGGAVVRNRVRRRLRAAAETVLPRHAAPGHDYVLIGRPATVNRPFGMLLDDLTAALRRVKAFKE